MYRHNVVLILIVRRTVSEPMGDRVINKKQELIDSTIFTLRNKIKDSKLGKFLKEKAPNVLNIVGDILPDSGALGIVKNLII